MSRRWLLWCGVTLGMTYSTGTNAIVCGVPALGWTLVLVSVSGWLVLLFTQTTEPKRGGLLQHLSQEEQAENVRRRS